MVDDGQHAEQVRPRQPERAKAKSRKRVLPFVLAIALVAILGGIGAVCLYYYQVSENLHAGLDPDLMDVLAKTDLTKEPFYMVLIGTDESAERAESGEYGYGAFRSDSIMLVRIDPINKKVTLVSIQRDTRVDLGEYGIGKINAAHAYEGPALTVQMVSELAGVPISQYAEVNFDGFCAIVDSLGGIEVDVPMDIDDADAGGFVAAGLQTLNGEQALILCRARHAYDDYGNGDAYRAANQRLVLGAIVKKVLSSDLRTMATSVNTLSQYVTTSLDLTDILGLAQALRGLDPVDDIYSAMQPTISWYDDENETWWELTDDDAWMAMMRRVVQGLPPTEESVIDPTGTIIANAGKPPGSPSQNGPSENAVHGSGLVVVKNGSGTTGVAAAAADRLAGVGYEAETGNADDYGYNETLVVYDRPEQAEEAQGIVSLLGVGTALLNDGTYAFDGDFLVVIGADWE